MLKGRQFALYVNDETKEVLWRLSKHHNISKSALIAMLLRQEDERSKKEGK